MAKFGRFICDFVTPTLVVLLSGVVAYDHLVAPERSELQASSIDGKALGRKFVKPMASSFASAWESAAEIIEQGKTVGDAQAALQTQWQAERAKVFTNLITPEFNKVLPEGTEPATPAQRAEVVKLWRDFAAGLKGGR